jgi:hypothetical protein
LSLDNTFAIEPLAQAKVPKPSPLSGTGPLPGTGASE